MKYSKKYYLENRETILKKAKEYMGNPKNKKRWKEYVKEYNKKYQQRPEIKKRRRDNKRLLRKNNSVVFLKKCRDYYKKTYYARPKKRITIIMSRAIGRSLVNGKDGRKWNKLVEYSTQQLMIHLEKQFKPKMSWKNYGKYWHIDHRIPIDKFDFESYTDEGFKNCWDLENLQPLESLTNWTKNNKYSEPTLNQMGLI